MWHDKSWQKQTLMHSKRKIPDSWRTGWKAKTYTSIALYLKVFKNHLYYVRHVRVLSIKLCLHTQLPEDHRSYWNVSRGCGHLITWNEPIMGHLNSFSASGGGNFPKIFQKFKCPGACPGGMFKLRFDWYIKKIAHFPKVPAHTGLTILDRLPKKNKNTLKATKLASYMNFRMIQAVIKCIKRSTVEGIEENSNDFSRCLFIR